MLEHGGGGGSGAQASLAQWHFGGGGQEVLLVNEGQDLGVYFEVIIMPPRTCIFCIDNH
jgi:hypothetical protein